MSVVKFDWYSPHASRLLRDAQEAEDLAEMALHVGLLECEYLRGRVASLEYQRDLLRDEVLRLKKGGAR